MGDKKILIDNIQSEIVDNNEQIEDDDKEDLLSVNEINTIIEEHKKDLNLSIDESCDNENPCDNQKSIEDTMNNASSSNESSDILH